MCERSIRSSQATEPRELRASRAWAVHWDSSTNARATLRGEPRALKRRQCPPDTVAAQAWQSTKKLPSLSVQFSRQGPSRGAGVRRSPFFKRRLRGAMPAFRCYLESEGGSS